MKFKRSLTALASICLLGLNPAWAHEGSHSHGTPPAHPHFAPGAFDGMDPVVRAVLIAMAARMLREAAASPDPMGALGDSLERTVSAALANPETLRMLEALTGQALRDVPDDLRHALMAFAASMLAHTRREMMQSRRGAPHVP